MSLQTGGRAIGATSTRSRSDSAASSRALPIGTMPTCSPSGPTRRTSGTRIRSLILGSELMGPPTVFGRDAAVLRGRPHDNGPAALVRTGPWIRPVRAVEDGCPPHGRGRASGTGPGAPRRLGWEAGGFRLHTSTGVEAGRTYSLTARG